MGTYSSRKSNYGAEIFGVLVVCAILLAFLALGIIFTFKLLRVIRTMSYTAATGQPSDDIPSYAIVFCYIMGGLSALSCLKGLSALLTGGCLAAAYILLGVFLTRYRNEMRRVAYEVSISAAYPAGGIQPQAQPIDAICSYCGAPRQN